jgi:hypothetical protein
MAIDTHTLPNLVIAGVGRAGTTSLFHLLGAHPQVCAATVKEADYFAPLRFPGGRLGPLAPYAALVAHCGPAPWRLEASPAYCYGGGPVIDAMRTVLGRPRVVLSLRDPVDRLASAHRDLRARGALPADMDLRAWGAACRRRREDGSDRLAAQRAYRGLSVGHYEEYVPGWLEAFGGDLRVVFFEQLARRPLAVVTALWRWLGLDDTPPVALDTSARNRSVGHRSELLRRAAYGLHGLARPLLRRRPPLVRALRRAYETVNATTPRDPVPPDLRAELTAHYRPGLAHLAATLRTAGYTTLPTWLTAAEVAHAPRRDAAAPLQEGAR